VLRSGSQPSSTELRWTPPATDIYGAPTSVVSMSIYRGTSAFFVPGPSNMIATVGPGVGVYTDPNAYVAPQDYYYLVGASDTNGFSSGLGLQLPRGITDLSLSVSSPNLVLNWSPVGTDIDGNPTLVDHYAVYADTQPVSRARVNVLAPLAPS